MAWAMLALIAYYEQQGGDKYLEAAKAMGEWLEAETRDLVGAGYTGGYEGLELTKTNTVPPKKLTYKAVEHNIDLYPVFLRLYNITGELKWYERAHHAKALTDSMWDATDGRFWVGTKEDGITTNTKNIGKFKLISEGALSV